MSETPIRASSGSRPTPDAYAMGARIQELELANAALTARGRRKLLANPVPDGWETARQLERELADRTAPQALVAKTMDSLVSGESPRSAGTLGVGHADSLPSAAPVHPHTDECGFDRNSSHSVGHYVCMCGYMGEDDSPVQPALPEKPIVHDFNGKEYVEERYARNLRAALEAMQVENERLRLDATRYAMLFVDTWQDGKGVAVFSYSKNLYFERLSIEEANCYLDSVAELERHLNAAESTLADVYIDTQAAERKD